ncbi:50S ribosomal protein L5 [Candidatus Saccharibacteria bacterium]|nr:MAG: 50S ribosomal protein L5 [Candidatus Saccharibacteria bacterium]
MAETKKKTSAKKAPVAASQARLKAEYLNTYVAQLQKELELGNVMEVPKLEKIVLNVGLGRAKDDKKMIEVATNTLRKITGQQPLETVAKKSIASFKLREGNKIGLKVTLRGDRMYEFMDRLINIVLPRLRDFHGVKAGAFDKNGNFSIGLTEQSVFPELTFDETTHPHGLQAVFVVRCKEPAHSRALLEKFGMPFEKKEAR